MSEVVAKSPGPGPEGRAGHPPIEQHGADSHGRRMRGARAPRKAPIVALAVAAITLAAVGSARADVEQQNLAQLTALARDIIVGSVTAVDDGVTADHLPFTEVTVALDRAVKGSLAGTYTFRQFGLLRPRPGPNGLTNLMVTPPGWATYRVGDEVMLFLYRPAQRTGLRTTVGLRQGAFRIENGRIASQAGNAGLFVGLDLPRSRRDRVARVRPSSAQDPMAAREFIDLVDTAVRESWFEPVP